jgi:hypothetical protein
MFQVRTLAAKALAGIVPLTMMPAKIVEVFEAVLDMESSENRLLLRESANERHGYYSLVLCLLRSIVRAGKNATSRASSQYVKIVDELNTQVLPLFIQLLLPALDARSEFLHEPAVDYCTLMICRTIKEILATQENSTAYANMDYVHFQACIVCLQDILQLESGQKDNYTIATVERFEVLLRQPYGAIVVKEALTDIVVLSFRLFGSFSTACDSISYFECKIYSLELLNKAFQDLLVSSVNMSSEIREGVLLGYQQAMEQLSLLNGQIHSKEREEGEEDRKAGLLFNLLQTLLHTLETEREPPLRELSTELFLRCRLLG